MEKTFDKIAIIGAAKSGIAAAKYWRDKGSEVFISDACSRAKLDAILDEHGLMGLGIESESEEHSDRVLENDLIILSPGVRSDLDILKKAASKNIPVWSEMELGFRASIAPFLAVTGSSGKSTTVSLLASAMSASGFETALVGNIGTPVISVTPNLSSDAVVVAEVSSFQLETIDRFKPKAAAVINLMKNHLDRYNNEEEYYEAKKLIAKNLTEREYLILNADDPRLVEWAKEFSSKTRVVMFGAGSADTVDKYNDHVYLSGSSILYKWDGRTGVILDDVARMKLCGRHNHINACAAAAMALAGGADPSKTGQGLCDFAGLPHRLEHVADIGGVAFYNDSKSTTAESIECAVRAFDSKVCLIAGGKDKGCDFSVINDAVRDNVKCVFLIGEAKNRMASLWDGVVPVKKIDTLEDAISAALGNAAVGEKVIFSPGCSSFDMFRNFEHRGEVFREIVSELAKRKAS